MPTKRTVRTVKSVPSARLLALDRLVPLSLVRPVALAFLLVLERAALDGLVGGGRMLAHSRVLPQARPPQTASTLDDAEGRSSTGRAPVSKTGGSEFESLRPCRRQKSRLRRSTFPAHARSPRAVVERVRAEPALAERLVLVP